MKTVKAYLKSIPDRGIRKKALRNLDPKFADHSASSITHALSLAFIYRETKEGEDFWSDVHFKYA